MLIVVQEKQIDFMDFREQCYGFLKITSFRKSTFTHFLKINVCLKVLKHNQDYNI